MDNHLYQDFLKSDDKLRIYYQDTLVFASQKDHLLPLLEYLDTKAADYSKVTICDTIMGNAAALLAVLADCRETFSPLGSDIAAATLKDNNILFHFDKTVPQIIRADGKDICPMEKLSLGKNSQEFLAALRGTEFYR